MHGLGREGAPFSGRVWQEIDQVVGSVRAANCTARRFLEVDGPYGLGLISVAGQEQYLAPVDRGARHQQWNVTQPEPPRGGDLAEIRAGTYLARGPARPVPLIASEFRLGVRALEAFEAQCQPLDLCAATDAARDVALEEERLLYYGVRADDEALLKVIQLGRSTWNATIVNPANIMASLHEAIRSLAHRGYAGPFALVVDPSIYSSLYSPVPFTLESGPAPRRAPRAGAAAAGVPEFYPVLLVDLLRSLFRGGIYMVPVIDPRRDPEQFRAGAVITLGRAYLRLVVGLDWATAYRGCQGVLYRFLIESSLQLRVCDPRSIQVLRWEAMPDREVYDEPDPAEAAI
jgi:uncharacterized linocin/CFP29 family protein